MEFDNRNYLGRRKEKVILEPEQFYVRNPFSVDKLHEDKQTDLKNDPSHRFTLFRKEELFKAGSEIRNKEDAKGNEESAFSAIRQHANNGCENVLTGSEESKMGDRVREGAVRQQSH